MALNRWTARAAALLAAGSLALGGCVVTPTPEAAPTTATRSAAEQRAGDQAYRQITAKFGGVYDNAAVQSYVRRIGMDIARRTEQPKGPWTFTVLDSPIVNAFATPGGYVYLTRGLIALAGDEAELAGVIGHEIGHVTAAHSARRDQRTSLAQLGAAASVIGAAALGLGRGAVEAIGQVAGVAAQGAVASYSRSQELEADALGVRYLAAAGYDPYAEATFLRRMRAQAALAAKLEGRGYNPGRVDFLSTHPANAERLARAERAAARLGAAPRAAGAARYLAAVDGMAYGDAAEQGFTQANRFVHPQLRIAFDAPPGFRLANRPDRVIAAGPNDAQMLFTGMRDPGGSLSALLNRWARGEIGPSPVERAGPPQRLTINGMQAARLRLPVGGGAADLTAIRGGNGQVYRFFSLTRAGDGAQRAALLRAVESFRRLSRSEAGRNGPQKLRVVTIRPGDTVERLAAQSSLSEAAAERLRVLNGLSAGEQPRPGSRFKTVTR